MEAFLSQGPEQIARANLSGNSFVNSLVNGASISHSNDDGPSSVDPDMIWAIVRSIQGKDYSYNLPMFAAISSVQEVYRDHSYHDTDNRMSHAQDLASIEFEGFDIAAFNAFMKRNAATYQRAIDVTEAWKYVGISTADVKAEELLDGNPVKIPLVYNGSAMINATKVMSGRLQQTRDELLSEKELTRSDYLHGSMHPNCVSEFNEYAVNSLKNIDNFERFDMKVDHEEYYTQTYSKTVGFQKTTDKCPVYLILCKRHFKKNPPTNPKTGETVYHYLQYMFWVHREKTEPDPVEDGGFMSFDIDGKDNGNYNDPIDFEPANVIYLGIFDAFANDGVNTNIITITR